VAESFARSAASAGAKDCGAFAPQPQARSRRHSVPLRRLERLLFAVAGSEHGVFLRLFRSESDSLELAQEQKLDHILNKLLVSRRAVSGHRLRLGCARAARAKKYGARATGVTLSRNQYEFAAQRIRERARGPLRGAAAGLPRCSARASLTRSRASACSSMWACAISRLISRKSGRCSQRRLVMNHGITASDPDNRWWAGAGNSSTATCSLMGAPASFARASRDGGRGTRGCGRRVAAASLRAHLPRVAKRLEQNGSRRSLRQGTSATHLAGLSRRLCARLRARVDEHLPGVGSQGGQRLQFAAAHPRLHVSRG